MTNLEAAKQAHAIVAMSNGPFCPRAVAASLAKVSPKVAAHIPSAAAMHCIDLRDGTFVCPA